jgi:hypothetical protein
MYVKLAHEISTVGFALFYSRDSKHLSCWLMNLCCKIALPSPRDSHQSCWLKILRCHLRTTQFTRFTASAMLAHESLLQNLHCPLQEIQKHRSCWLITLCCHLRTDQFTRFTASVILAHDSLLLYLHCPHHEIHSICHAGS